MQDRRRPAARILSDDVGRWRQDWNGRWRVHDYAVARLPRRAPLVMAAYYDAPGLELEAQEAVLREVGSAITAWAG